MKSEIKITREVILQPLGYDLSTLIVYAEPRESDFIIYYNSWLEAASDFSKYLKI